MGEVRGDGVIPLVQDRRGTQAAALNLAFMSTGVGVGLGGLGGGRERNYGATRESPACRVHTRNQLFSYKNTTNPLGNRAYNLCERRLLLLSATLCCRGDGASDSKTSLARLTTPLFSLVSTSSARRHTPKEACGLMVLGLGLGGWGVGGASLTGLLQTKLVWRRRLRSGSTFLEASMLIGLAQRSESPQTAADSDPANS